MQNEILFLLQNLSICFSLIIAFFIGKKTIIATISLFFVIANLFVVKQITLFGLEVTAADSYIVGAVLGFNLLQENWGKKSARNMIFIGFFVSIVFLIMSRFHLL